MDIGFSLGSINMKDAELRVLILILMDIGFSHKKKDRGRR